MTIKLISRKKRNLIRNIFKNYPGLTFENKGYQYLHDLTDAEKKAIEKIEAVLKKHIIGFSEFNNFRIRGKEIQLRIQYNWTADDDPPGMYFHGVGYIYLSELRFGFKKKGN